MPASLADVAIAGLIGWEAAAAVTSSIPPPSRLLRRRPRWARVVFAGALAGTVLVHLWESDVSG